MDNAQEVTDAQVLKTTTRSSVRQPLTSPLGVTAPAPSLNNTSGGDVPIAPATLVAPLLAHALAPAAASDAAHVAAPDAAPVEALAAPPSVLRIRCRNPRDGVEAVRRLIIYNNKTSKVASATVGERIKLEYSDFLDGTNSVANCSLLVRDIGVAIRTHVPMTASIFFELKEEEKVANYYEVPRSDVDMWRCIDTKSYERYKAWKHQCHSHFKKHGAAVPFEFLNCPHEWDYLVEKEFLNVKKISISVRNQKNRTKNPNPINHYAGARALSYMAEEHLKAGHPIPYCAATVAYITSKNRKEKVLALKRRLDDIIEERKEEEDSKKLRPLSVEEQRDLMEIDFGQRKGTEVRGAGAAFKRAAKAQGGSRINIAQLEEKNREAVERVDHAEEKTKMLEDRVKVMEDALQKFLDAQSGNDE